MGVSFYKAVRFGFVKGGGQLLQVSVERLKLFPGLIEARCSSPGPVKTVLF